MGYITEEGRDNYLAELREVEMKIGQVRTRRNQAGLKMSASNNYSGDRDPFAEEEQQLVQRKRTLETYLACPVFPKPQQCDKVRISHTVHATCLDDGSAHVFTVVGMGEGDCPSSPPRYSYESPFARAFLGNAVGDEVRVQSRGMTHDYRIDNITLAENQGIQPEQKRA